MPEDDGRSYDGAPDADLIRLCSRFVDLEQARQIFLSDGGDPCESTILDAQALLIAAIEGAKATTLAGLIGRARALAAWAPGLLDADGPDSPCWDDRLAAALMRDLVALAA